MYATAKISFSIQKSHPAWDEWIEIIKIYLKQERILSHPAWDEWIEIAEPQDQ